MNDHEFWNELGNLYFMNGAYEPAVNAYLRSIQLDGKFGRSYSNLALAFVHTGRYTDAIKLYRRSIELLQDVKEKAITWNRLGILYRQIRDYKNALEAYQQADVLAQQQDLERGGDNFENKNPLTVSTPLFDLNSILDKDGPAHEALKVKPSEKFNTLVKSAKSKVEPPWFDDDLVPLDPEKILQEMEAKPQDTNFPVSERGQWTPAFTEEAAFTKITEDEQSTQNEELGDNFEFGEIVEEENEALASLEATESDLVQYSQTMDPLPELSPAELKSIELDIAKYKAETINNPRNVSAWERLGDAYKSAGMYKDAIQAIKTAIANNSTKPAYYYRLGLIYAAERREAEAVLAFEKVLELNPKHALAHASLGSHYKKMGMEELAQSHIKQALNTNFEDENEYNRACLEAICGNTDRAIELLQIALQTKQTYIDWAKNDPDLDSLHDDHRFKTLLSAYAVNA